MLFRVRFSNNNQKIAASQWTGRSDRQSQRLRTVRRRATSNVFRFLQFRILGSTAFSTTVFHVPCVLIDYSGSVLVTHILRSNQNHSIRKLLSLFLLLFFSLKTFSSNFSIKFLFFHFFLIFSVKQRQKQQKTEKLFFLYFSLSNEPPNEIEKSSNRNFSSFLAWFFLFRSKNFPNAKNFRIVKKNFKILSACNGRTRSQGKFQDCVCLSFFSTKLTTPAWLFSYGKKSIFCFCPRNFQLSERKKNIFFVDKLTLLMERKKTFFQFHFFLLWLEIKTLHWEISRISN